MFYIQIWSSFIFKFEAVKTEIGSIVEKNMKVLNMLYVCKTLIHMFLMYCLVNQAAL